MKWFDDIWGWFAGVWMLDDEEEEEQTKRDEQNVRESEGHFDESNDWED